ncbi:MAG TPA: HEAT repeat domain-containing protein [Kofleriaceae bacterium]|nr:HEAT repeat domain-containing protein [Kofleriaceae bacterium]
MRLVIALLLASGSVVGAGCMNRAGQSVSLYESGDYAGAARAADEGLAAHPKDSGLWQMRVRSALALGDGDGVAKAYAGYRAAAGEDDRELLRDLATATLGQALASPSVKLKLVAIEAVAAAELQALADQVAERMGDDDDRVAAAASAAVLRGYPQAPQVASQMLRSDDPEARRLAVEGVGKKVGKLALVDLQKLAGSDPDARVRVAAIRWLGQLRDKEAVELLGRQLRHTDENVRAAAASALARIKTGDLVGFAGKALADRSLAVRLAGVELLEAANRPDELSKLVEDRDPMVAAEAAIALHRPELAAKALDRAATAEAWTIRAGAANMAVRAIGEDRAVALARKLVADPEVGVRLAAARVLAHGGDREAALAVFTAALTGDSALAAAIDLASLDDRRGAETLDKLVRDRGASADQRAAAASAHRAAHRVTPGLVAALADPSGLVRVEAAAAIVLTAKK